MNEVTKQLYVERFRPQDWDALICDNKNLILKHLDSPSTIPSFIFYSNKPGTGKTSAAKLIIKHLDCDSITINASDERGIETIREKLTNFARSMSSNPNVKKCVFLDEADSMCLDKNTKVFVSFDKVKWSNMKIKDLKGKSFYVLGMNSDKTVEVVDATGLYSGEKEMFEIEFENGKKITCSEEHPFFVLDANGKVIEKKLKQLTPEDSLIDLEDYILDELKCKICGFIPKKSWGLSEHVVDSHKISTAEYYNTYIGEKGNCIVCGKPTKFKGLTRGYITTCSSSCKGSFAGKRSQASGGKDNWKTMAGIRAKEIVGKTYEQIYGNNRGKLLKEQLRVSHLGKSPSQKTRILQSNIMKSKILEGSFTPNTGNRLVHKKLKVVINNKEYQFRSSWELEFAKFLLNSGIQDIGYEELRIPYTTPTGKNRVYVVDFICKDLGVVFEVKPSSLKDNELVKSKDSALLKFCKRNKLKRIIVTEKDLKSNFTRIEKYVKTK